MNVRPDRIGARVLPPAARCSGSSLEPGDRGSGPDLLGWQLFPCGLIGAALGWVSGAVAGGLAGGALGGPAGALVGGLGGGLVGVMLGGGLGLQVGLRMGPGAP